jgi:hypothetical protein
MKKIVLLILLSFAAGCALGYLGAWVDHEDEIATYGLAGPNISHSEIYPFWEWVTAPAELPGSLVAIARHSQDWCIDEGWDYRWDITFGNGVIYAIVCCVFLAGRSFVTLLRRRLKLRTTHAR